MQLQNTGLKKVVQIHISIDFGFQTYPKRRVMKEKKYPTVNM